MGRLLARASSKMVIENNPPSTRIIGITSPIGSTGKTTVAINLAMELSGQKKRVLLIDGHLGAPNLVNNFLLSEIPVGLPAVLRIANQNRLDQAQLDRLSLILPNSSVKLLPGANQIDQELLTETAILALLESCRAAFDYVVIDLPATEQTTDQKQYLIELFSRHLDQLWVVGLADPVGIFRLLAIESKLASFPCDLIVLVNRVRNSVIAGAKREIAITFARLSQLEISGYLPEDSVHIDQAMKSAVPVSQISRSGAFKVSLMALVRSKLLGTPGQLDGRVAKLG